MKPTLRCPCGEDSRAPIFEYDAPPDGETPLPIAGPYRRRYDACAICGHFFGVHDLDLPDLYAGAYVDATYKSADGMAARFHQIVSLLPARSDNAARSVRVDAFARARNGHTTRLTLLDVGAGLGVFPHAMKEKGWNVTAVDPDPRACRHIQAMVGISTLTGNFLNVDTRELGLFDAVTFNKVLEHVEDPTALLTRAVPLLKPGGFVYMEVPDVAAAVAGPGREEFFIDHHHVFSPASLARLAAGAALDVLRLERVREPSTKFTLFAFAAPNVMPALQ